MSVEMTLQFTGERLVPGQTEPDLYAEHVSRYQFASRFAAGKRVLDAGCGTGYGAQLLASVARSVVAFDLSLDAVRYAATHFKAPNLSYLVGDCKAIPFPDACFDFIVTFEVIEHLEDPAAYMKELSRLLAPGGLLLLSTPNKYQYSDAIPGYSNPYHKHEFYFVEWNQLLTQTLASVRHFTQDYTHALTFREYGAGERGTVVEPLHLQGDASNRPTRQGNIEDAQFFVSLCAHQPSAIPFAPTRLFPLPGSNLLAEKDRWIAALRNQVEQADVVVADLQRQLVEHTAWAQRAVGDVQARDSIILDLQRQVAEQTASALNALTEVQRRDAIILEQTAWAQRAVGDVQERDSIILDLQRQVAEQTASALNALTEVQRRDAIILELQQRVE